MGSISVAGLGKAYKQYPTRWSRLLEWLSFGRSRRHSLKWVLRDVSFELRPGESLGIMGINGAGKSTLLKLITGTTQPTEGSVRFAGRVAALLELGIGFHPEFTGRQNALMAGQLLGIGHAEMSELLPQVEAFAEIGEYIDQPVRVYSSGMQVRLAFSVATAVRPDILIVDEALAVGDAYFQAKCYQRISEFKERGTTLLLVSHAAGDVVRHCERAILLKNGRVEMDGSAREVSNRYLDELFGKKPSQPGIAAATGDVPDHLLQDNEELFHSRPGYNKDEHRWGHGGAVILDYSIVSKGCEYPGHLPANEPVEFYFKVSFLQDVESVVPGLLIKTLDGLFLYGTNSFVASNGREYISARAGDVCLFRFELPMDLNEGNYLVSFGVSSGDPSAVLVPLERRYDAVLVQVVRKLPFWGVVDLRARFEARVLSRCSA